MNNSNIFNAERPGFQGQTLPLSMFRSRYDSAQMGFYKDINGLMSYAEFYKLMVSYAQTNFAFKKAAPLLTPAHFQLISGQIGTDGRRCKGYRTKSNVLGCRLMMFDSDDGGAIVRRYRRAAARY
jgi:hypothetical protein